VRLSRRLWERLREVRRPKNIWIRWIRIRNNDSHLEKRGGGHCQLGEAVQEVVGEAEGRQVAQGGQTLGGESGQAIVGQGEHLQGLKRRGEIIHKHLEEQGKMNKRERQYLELYLKRKVQRKRETTYSLLTCSDSARITKKRHFKLDLKANMSHKERHQFNLDVQM
jgi:hypothetical protein